MRECAEVIKIGAELAQAVELALPGWVRACVQTRAVQAFGQSSPEIDARADEAAQRVLAAIVPELRALLGVDVDEQRTTPIALLRRAVQYPTEALAALEVPPVPRDRFAVERFPHDLYALMPVNLEVLGETVGELAIAWGAAKAYEHRRRHRGR